MKAEHISKMYQLGDIGTGTISRDIERWWAKLRGKEDPFLKIGELNDRTRKSESNISWSLKDINFEIEQGQAVGVIGRNGAGKSTLLKILSRVTAPTIGKIYGNGRVASLLEVGTGFHPELTGRENIYLNGAILGMRKREIDRKFDEIVDFSGVERYIDTPVKRYSSGMYVRLAFAVAAHLESEILIVDEVLAVGDAEFQKKCLGKMGEVSNGEGRTVLFVSHNMGAISQLCSTCMVLDRGEMICFADTAQALNVYRDNNSSQNVEYKIDGSKNAAIYFKRIFLSDMSSNPVNEFFYADAIKLNFELNSNISLESNDSYSIFCTIVDSLGIPIFSSESFVIKSHNIQMIIRSKFLVRGNYKITAFVHKPKVAQIDSVHEVCEFKVIDDESPFVIHGDYNYGFVFGDCEWNSF